MARPTGTPTWLNYSSTPLDRAEGFYGAIFGWTFTDTGPEQHHYTMVDKDGGPVCGMMDSAHIPGAEGMPARWDVYLAVDDIKARLQKSKDAGATVLLEPAEMPGTGTFALIADPTGASVGMWQDGGFAGYQFTGGPGTPVWFELMSMDFAASAKFYAEVFDFDITPMDGDEDSGYATNVPIDRASSGICAASAWFPACTTSFWRVYFGVTDADRTVAQITEMGGQLLDGPMDSPFGRVATVADPTGATFQINQPLGN